MKYLLQLKISKDDTSIKNIYFILYCWIFLLINIWLLILQYEVYRHKDEIFSYPTQFWHDNNWISWTNNSKYRCLFSSIYFFTRIIVCRIFKEDITHNYKGSCAIYQRFQPIRTCTSNVIFYEILKDAWITKKNYNFFFNSFIIF
jgi:hypothetical protein